MLLNNNADVDVFNNYGETALILGNSFFKKGILSINKIFNFEASKYGNDNIVNILLKNKANFETRSEEGNTALVEGEYNRIIV